MDHPVTTAIRALREAKVEFSPHLYDYVEKGGTRVSAEALGVDEHAVIKTLVFETDAAKPFLVLMHGDRQVSAKELARQLKVRSVQPASPERAQKVTGYLVGGTSPFGAKTRTLVYVERTIFDLPRIYINGGKRGFLVSLAPSVLRQILEVTDVSVAIEDQGR
jgi:Cys-tRNA(Pro) deacylase